MYWLQIAARCRKSPAHNNDIKSFPKTDRDYSPLRVVQTLTFFLPFFFFCKHFLTPAENRDSVSESGILVSRAVELTIDEATLKPAGQPRQRQVACVLRRPRFRLNALLSVFSLVVGVKLNVSFWMNSFMNATLKLNVSPVAAFCLS